MNIRDVAKLANVSKSTVSRVLNNNSNVSEETRKHVLRVIEEKGYTPNLIAQSLKTKRTKTIGIVVPDIGNPFYYEILRGIEKVLDRYDFNMIFCNSEYDPAKELRYFLLLASRKVDGIIAALCSEESRSVKPLMDTNVPFVLLDVMQKHERTSLVFVDHFKVSHTATFYLIRCGHERIVAIDALREPYTESSFVRGYRKAMEESGLPIAEGFVQETSADISGGYQAIKRLVSAGVEFTAVVCICDLVAVGVYRAAKELRLRVPENISVIGNDDIPLAKYLAPPLTTVHQPKYKLGYKSAKLLIEHIQSGTHDNEKVKIVELPTRLIIRDSVAKRTSANIPRWKGAENVS